MTNDKDVLVYVVYGVNVDHGETEKEIIYAGTDSTVAYGPRYLGENYYADVYVEVWKAGKHIHTSERNSSRKGWSVEYDLEKQLKSEIETLKGELAKKLGTLNSILREPEPKKAEDTDIFGPLAEMGQEIKPKAPWQNGDIPG